MATNKEVMSVREILAESNEHIVEFLDSVGLNDEVLNVCDVIDLDEILSDVDCSALKSAVLLLADIMRTHSDLISLLD